METTARIKQQITSNPIILYMKGSPQLPNCGFSAQAVQLLNNCQVQFAHVDVLTNPDIRAALPAFANWPTFPQLWVNGELIGGSDIMIELYHSGELKKLLDQVQLRPEPCCEEQ